MYFLRLGSSHSSTHQSKQANFTKLQQQLYGCTHNNRKSKRDVVITEKINKIKKE